MELRLSCAVPFCRHTRGQRKGEPPIRAGEQWVCGQHWQATPKAWRRRLALLRRAYRKRYGSNPPWAYPAGSEDRIGAVRIADLTHKLWERCKRAAIERAAGL